MLHQAAAADPHRSETLHSKHSGATMLNTHQPLTNPNLAAAAEAGGGGGEEQEETPVGKQITTMLNSQQILATSLNTHQSLANPMTKFAAGGEETLVGKQIATMLNSHQILANSMTRLTTSGGEEEEEEEEEDEDEDEEEGHLLQRYLQLQRDWAAYKRSAPCHHRSRFAAMYKATTPTPPRILEFFHGSPKQLLSSPRGDGSPCGGWGARTTGLDAEEVSTERLVVTGSGRLRGRRILKALEGAWEETSIRSWKKESCSVCSSSLTQGGSPTGSSSCSCCRSPPPLSSDASGVGVEGYSTDGYWSSSSSSLSLVYAEGEKDAVGARPRGDTVVRDDGGRWALAKAWMAVALTVISIGIMLLQQPSMEEDGDGLIPT